MSDLFWLVATSNLALTIDAVILIAAAVVGYFPLARLVPVLGAYVEAAKLVFAIILFVTGVAIGHRLADESAELKQVKADLALTRLQLEAQKESAETAAKLRADAEAKADQANQKVQDYEAKLAKQPQGCGCDLDDNDVNSLRDIAR